MTRKTTRRLLAVLVMGAVLSFAFASANHWHRNPVSQEKCQICHLAHSVSFAVDSTAPLLAPAAVTKLVVPACNRHKLNLDLRQVSPRAPPFAFLPA